MKPFDVLKPIPFRTYEEEEYLMSGYATPKGNQDLANEMAFLYRRGGEKRAEELRIKYDLWPSLVPSILITSAFNGLATGYDHYFKVLFVENDTKIRFDRLESAIIRVDETHPWLYWEETFDKLNLQYEEGELVNPKFLLSILKPDEEAERVFREAKSRGEMPNRERVMW